MARPTKKNPKGAQIKTKRTKEALQKLEQAFAMDCSVGEACLYADISPSTYYEWVKDEPKLSERFTALRNKPVLKARTEVIKGLDNNPEFSLKYLERKRKIEFAVRQEVTGADGNSVEIVNYNTDKLTDEQLRKLLEIKESLKEE